MKITDSLKRGFWEKVDKRGPDECWEWTGALNGAGLDQYGRLWDGKGVEYAHRISWRLHNGRIGDLCVLHKCDNPQCVNPGHLFLGTKSDNMLDKHRKGRGNVLEVRKDIQGEKHPQSKLDERQVKEIWRLHKQGETFVKIGRMFSVHPSQVSNIVNRKQWRHI